jgi:hypothetical protein
MTTLTTLFRTLAAAAFAASLTACATKVVPPPTPQLADLLSQANQAIVSGDKEKAVTLWKQTATVYPTEKTPWVNITQTRYDAGQYGEAIINAQEILVRDPANIFANSIIATSGLRLSTRALADLTRNSNLSGSVRAESQDLAKLLRESLGEHALFVTTTRTPTVTAADTGKKPPRKPKDSKAGDSDSKADPFSTLK